MTAAAAADPVACPHAPQCGGCSLIDLPYSEQLAVKRRRIESAAARYGVLEGIAVDEVLPATDRCDYRVRAKLMVGVAPAAEGAPSRRPIIGLYARGAERDGDRASDHVIADVPQCRVLHPELRETAARLRALLEHLPRPAAVLAPASGGGRLSALDLRYVENERPGESGVLVTLVLDGEDALDAQQTAAVVAAVRESGSVLGIAANYRRSGAPQVLGPMTQWLWGARAVPDRLGRVYHLATYGSFVQAHRGQAERVADLIAAHLGARRPVAGSRILDLYGGSGALSLPLASAGAEVTLVEAFPVATECADRAARDQGFAAFTVHAGDAAKVARRLDHEGARFDAVIANPPRRGIDGDTRRAIASLAPAMVAYLSCDPDTLVRDLADLAWLGYRTPVLRPVDMIPLTDHVETLAILERGAPPLPRVLYEDAELCAISKRAHQPEKGAFERVLWSPADDESGPLLIAKGARGDRRRRTSSTYVGLVRGITHKRGSLGAARYERVAIALGHSLVRWTSSEPSARTRQVLARIGHPVIGDRRFGDPATNRHFEEKHTLDRALLHCIKVEWSRGDGGAGVAPVVFAPLADELTAALAKFGIDAAKHLMVG